MRKLFSLLFALFLIAGLIFHDAEARRFGGGRSFGMQRSASSFSRVQPAIPQIPKQASPASRWLGPLAGLAAGGLLSYLLMGHGLGTGMLSWLALAAIGLLIWNFIRNRMQPAAQLSQYDQYRANTMRDTYSPFTSHAAANQANHLPVGFDPVVFLRDAKVQFMRLQAAYDSKNLNDLRQFTVPEVFAEIQMQLQERGNEVNQTEVVTLNAELLDVENEFQATIASVHFSGLIRENPSNPAVPFNETWHFKKEGAQSNWLVAGVQQQVN